MLQNKLQNLSALSKGIQRFSLQFYQVNGMVIVQRLTMVAGFEH